jgi:hypothetical protein
MKINKPKYNKINLQTLKPKRRKVGNNVRTNDRTCPNCLSALKVSTDGSWECTGNRLKFWEEEFKKFDLTVENEKENFLKNFSNPIKFLDMKDQWMKNREINCGFNSRLFYPNTGYSVQMPDPIVVGKIEKGLKRTLTEEEIAGEKSLFKLDGVYLTEYKEGAERIDIPMISFPEDT